MRHWRSRVLGLIAAAGAASSAWSQVVDTSWDGAWTTLASVPAEHAQREAWVRPDIAQPVFLNLEAMKDKLRAAPHEDAPGAREHAVVISLPTPEGVFHRFRVVDSPVMHPALAAKYPEIKTYLGQGVDDPAATLRMDVTPLGFHAQVLTPGRNDGDESGSYWIDPYTKNDTVLYTSYHKSGLRNTHGFECHTAGRVDLPAELKKDGGFGGRTSGNTRREFALANACTGEYAARFYLTTDTDAVKKSKAQAAIVVAVNRVNGVYELEVAARMILIANNDAVVYINGATDPYTNSDGGAMLSQNQTTLNSVIGSANYDFGHVFSTGGGGIAGLGVLCGTSKAWGVTGLPNPTGDAFYIDYVAHEMGHQFGGNHSFNSSVCAGNRNSSTAYEVGSGSTIMSYAGICGADNTQTHSDAYFLFRSHEEIMAHLGSRSCDTEVATGNNIPTVDAGPNFTIPANTPFTLTPASFSDADGDVLSFCWEENDLGAAQGASGGIFVDNGTSPFIRSWTATTSPSRTIPRISNLIANTFAKGERLPVTSRTLRFKCTVRDNRAGNGGVFSDTMQLTTTTAAGPFLVTFPNAAGTHSGTISATWDVAGTTAAPVNCANVKISLSTDGGNTFPTVLIASTPNDGSEAVTLPSINTTTARIKVEAVGNIFFDISNANFTINPGNPPNTPTNIQATPNPVCNGQNTSLTATVGSGEEVVWYTGGCGTTLAGTGSPLVVTPGATTTYFARARRISDNIFSTNCGSVIVTVNPLPVAPTSAGVDRNDFCASDAGSITLTASGGSGTSLRWYEGSCGGTLVGTGSPLVIDSPTADTTYFARWENSCGNSSCASVSVNTRTADFNGDGFVSGDDFDAYVAAFESGDPGADYNGDGFVSGDDFDAYVADFEAGC